jgi:hypothetical protein
MVTHSRYVMSYCHNCGKMVDEDDQYCSKCGAALKQGSGDLATEAISIGYPEAENPELEISVAVAGYIKAEPDGEKLIEGTIEYNLPEWRPEITQTRDTVAIRQLERYSWRAWDNPVNDWDIKLGAAKPYRLRVKAGVGRGTWSLGGLPLTGLSFDTGVSQSQISFDAPNPHTMNVLRIQTGVGETRLTGLLNARFREMKLSGGVGEVKMDFTGSKPEQDTHIKIDGGVGAFDVKLDKVIPAVFYVSGLTGVTTRGGVVKRRGGFGRGEYATEALESKGGPKLVFDISLGVGGVTLSTI